MVKKIKVGGKKTTYTLAVDIGGTIYNVPLARSMTYKELRGLKDEDAMHDFFAKYIEADVLDNLTVDEFSQIVDAWAEANKDTEGSTLGE